MEIIDAQMHDPHPVAPWPFGKESLDVLSVEMAREALDCVGVDAALLITREDYCALAMERYPDRFRGCIRLDPNTPDIENFIADYATHDGMLALRAVIRAWEDLAVYPEFFAGKFEPIFTGAERHHLPLFVTASGHIPLLEPVIERHPDLTMIIDHLGLDQQPAHVGEHPFATLPDVLRLAQYPNVLVKITGAITLSRTPYPHPDLWPHLLKMLDAFGPERIMWGSDFTRLRFGDNTIKEGPRAGWHGIYSNSVGYLRDTNEISEADKSQIFAGTIRRALRWPPRPIE